MLDANSLANAYKRNAYLVKRHCDGVTHDESLIQPPFNHNCMNWVVGHIVATRDQALALVGAEPALGAPGKRYLRESAPIDANSEDVIRLEDLLAALDVSQERLAAALANWDAAGLAREIDVPAFGRTMIAGEAIFFYYFHDTYHVGQTDILRQLTGKHDKVL